jgi:hypothetical protein
MKNGLNVVASIGLAIGGALGMAGSFVASANLRSIFWGIDGTCVVVATAILAIKFFRAGNDAAAAGFLVFSMGEGLMLSGTAQPFDAMVPAFCAGAGLWAAGLLLTGVSQTFALWIRVVSVIAAIVFATTSIKIFAGAHILPNAFPLPSLGYPFLVLAFVGWIWTLMREG